MELCNVYQIFFFFSDGLIFFSVLEIFYNTALYIALMQFTDT